MSSLICPGLRGLCLAALLAMSSGALAQTPQPDPEALQREAMQKLVEKQAREGELKAIEQRLAGNSDARAALEKEIAGSAPTAPPSTRPCSTPPREPRPPRSGSARWRRGSPCCNPARPRFAARLRAGAT